MSAPVCPKGQRYDTFLKKCIPVLESPFYLPCRQGYEKDPVTGECVPIRPTPPIPQHPPTQNPNPPVVVIAAVGDSRAEAEADKTFGNIVKEKPHAFMFLGDTSYDDNDSTPWCKLIDKHGLKAITTIALGNHEDAEEDADGAKESIAKWNPEWAKNNWCSSKIVGNAYIINMNSQDLDYSYAGRPQYNWVKSELERAVQLRSEGKIDWIFVNIHKPNYTLKTKHAAELKARDIYQPLFDKAQVDVVSGGHNHDCQVWKPMSYNNKQLYALTADKKAFDFTKPHGQLIMVNGLAGRGQTPIKEDWKKNPNVLFASWSFYGYTMYYIKGRQMTMQIKDNSGKVLYQVVMDKTGGQQVPPTQPQPNPPTPPTNPPPTQPQNPTNPPPAGVEIDEHGIAWFIAKGKTVVVPQSRDEADDDRWSENVPGCELGFEQTMIAKSIGVASDGHFASKQGGSNHSKGDWQNERWLDTGVRSDGTVQLQWEGPHPKNNDFTLPDTKQFIKNIGVKLEGNWIGLKWAQIKLKGAQGSPANGGVRWLMWVNTNIAEDGKPDNSKWRLVYDFIDGVDVKVIQPQDFVMKGTMDAEIRRSGTKEHQVYAGGLLVRPLK